MYSEININPGIPEPQTRTWKEYAVDKTADIAISLFNTVAFAIDPLSMIGTVGAWGAHYLQGRVQDASNSQRISAIDPQSNNERVAYTRYDVVDSKGRHWKRVTLTLAKDLDECRVNLEFEKFKTTMLDPVPFKMIEDDVVRWTLGNSIHDPITVQLKTKRENYDGKTTDTLHLPKTQDTLAMFEILRSNAKNEAVFNTLLLAQKGHNPIAPVGFEHKDLNCTLNSIMQAMFATPILEEMIQSEDDTLMRISGVYKRMRDEGKGDLHNLFTLRKSFDPRATWSGWLRRAEFTEGVNVDLSKGPQDTYDYYKVILNRLGPKHYGKLFGKTVHISQDDDIQTALRREHIKIPEISIPVGSPNLHLQEEFEKVLASDPNPLEEKNQKSIYFEKAPIVLPIQIEGGNAIGVPLRLELPYQHILDDGENITYELQSFTVHKAAEGHGISYVRTVENIDGKLQSYYWLIDDTDYSAKPQAVSESQFLTEARLANQLFYQRKDTIDPIAHFPA